jgi:hypothetical protein
MMAALFSKTFHGANAVPLNDHPGKVVDLAPKSNHSASCLQWTGRICDRTVKIRERGEGLAARCAVPDSPAAPATVNGERRPDATGF